MLLGWTVLQPSARERRWLLAGTVACLFVAAVLFFAAAAMDPRHPARVGAAAVVAFAASLWGVARLHRPLSGAFQLSIREGRVRLRRSFAGEAEPDSPARCVFAAPWLITFRLGSTFVRVWPDSLSPEAFRRVHACVRWEPSGADSKQLSGPRPGNESDA